MEIDPTVEIERFQIFAIIGSIIYLFFIGSLIRSKKLREDYSILWVFLGLVILVRSIWRESLEYISRFMGVAYAPAAIFILLIGALVLICIQFSTIISKQANQISTLAREIALLKNEPSNDKSEPKA